MTNYHRKCPFHPYVSDLNPLTCHLYIYDTDTKTGTFTHLILKCLGQRLIRVRTDTESLLLHHNERIERKTDVRVSFQHQSPAVICHSVLNHRSLINGSHVPVSFFPGYLPSLLLDSLQAASVSSTFLLYSISEFSSLHLICCSKQSNQ